MTASDSLICLRNIRLCDVKVLTSTACIHVNHDIGVCVQSLFHLDDKQDLNNSAVCLPHV